MIFFIFFAAATGINCPDNKIGGFFHLGLQNLLAKNFGSLHEKSANFVIWAIYFCSSRKKYANHSWPSLNKRFCEKNAI